MAKKETAAVRERILNEARKLFIKNGYTGTSIRDIATASDANIALINYYFTSKDKLFEIIFDEAFDIFVKRIFNVLNSDIPFEDLIKSWINTYYEVLFEYPQIPIFILHEINQNPKRLVDIIKRHQTQDLFYHLAARIDEEVKKGTIRETPPIDLSLNILSLCVFPFMFGKMATEIAEQPLSEYNKVLLQHKEYVIGFIFNALRL